MRFYRVFIPSSYNKNKKLPLIFNFHGGGGNATQHQELTQMDKKAEEAGFMVVYPQGIGLITPKKLGTWNAGDNCCGKAQEENIDDIKFVNRSINDLIKRFNIDTKRIYATGFSNGAIFCYRLACELSNRIAAIAPVAGHLDLKNCNPQRAVPILDIKGKQDKCIAYEGGICGGCLGRKKWPCPSADENLRYFANLYNCANQPKIKNISSNVTIETYENCKNGCKVKLLTIANLGHQWAGGKKLGMSEEEVGPYLPEPELNDLIWDFFEEISLP
jgi:polyhydroxybutyrate depolymerase